MKWLYYIGGLAIYTVIIYLLFYPEIKKADEPPYWAEHGFKPEVIEVEKEVIKSKLVPYPVEIPPKVIVQYDTVPEPYAVYVDREDSTKTVKITDAHGKYPYLIAGDFNGEAISLTLEDTAGQRKTEYYPTTYSDYNYRYTNNLMTTEQKSTRDKRKTTTSTPFIRYDRTFVEYKHDFIDQGKAVGINSGVTIKDRVRVSGFAELGIHNTPTQAGVKVGFKLF